SREGGIPGGSGLRPLSSSRGGQDPGSGRGGGAGEHGGHERAGHGVGGSGRQPGRPAAGGGFGQERLGGGCVRPPWRKGIAVARYENCCCSKKGIN
ncbi:MAG: hypothetical protein ACE14V_13605, partial [bacterium]